jgi:hypothetical protein
VDALIVLLLAIGIWVTHKGNGVGIDVEEVERYEVMLNPEYREDVNAFMMFANELGLT